MTLQELHQKNHELCTCALKETATQPVFGNGNEQAEIVFIGEAPGKDEDLQGIPFVGRAGKFLTEMLEMIQMKREDIYITNTVKYRPPNNRDPLPEEKVSCLPWLVEELEYIKPKIIILLGRHSLNTFFPGESISQVHGKLLKKKVHFIVEEKKISMPNEYYLPLYHPAAAMYNGALRETLIEDFKKIPIILKQI
jgi:uracil-DNA glycosylase family 4